MEQNLPLLQLRDYQLPLWRHIQNGGKRAFSLWHRRCIAEDTPIAMSDGSFKNIQDIESGDMVLSYNGVELEEDTVERLWANGEKEVADYNGLLATPDHQVLNYRRVGYCDIDKASHLVNGGELSFGGVHDTELAEILGLLLSDGYVRKNQTPKFTNVDPDLIDRFISLVERRFPEIRPKKREKGNGWDVHCYLKKKTNFHILRKYFIDSNEMPDIIWDLDRESTLAFISGVISGDGSISYRETAAPRGGLYQTGAMVIEAGISPGLAEKYRLLLLKFGIRAKIKKDPRHNNHRVFCYSLRDVGRLSGIKIASKHKMERFNRIKPSRKRFNNMKRDKVKKGASGRLKVYDLQVKNNHSYVANGYIVHNCGKDITLFNLMIYKAFERRGIYYYMLPTLTQAKKIIWDGVTNDGMKFLEYAPPSIIANKNNTELKLELTNGSIIQLIGTDYYDSVRGTNPVGCVFSEYAFQNPMAWEVVKPILKVNGGWAVFNSTPNGKNHAWELFTMAEENENWFTEKLAITDTGVLTEKDMEEERKEGMSEEMIQQEYYVSWDIGTLGSYYANHVNEARDDGRICNVPIEKNVVVDVYFDLGRSDSTVMIFVQSIGKEIRIVDCYENNGEGVDHYLGELDNKDFRIGRLFLPHDATYRKMESNKTIEEQFREGGFQTEIIEKIGIQHGIQQVRKIFPRLWFDKEKTFPLVKALENYHAEYDEKRRTFKNTPNHDWSSHFSDGMRYLGIGFREKIIRPKFADTGFDPFAAI